MSTETIGERFTAYLKRTRAGNTYNMDSLGEVVDLAIQDVLALEAYKRWAEDVARPALREIQDGISSDRTIRAEDLWQADHALKAYPQPEQEPT
mgnify:CR=1 FL=1